MRKIIYYVASSIDGFISGPEGDISAFEHASQSNGVERYNEDLQKFDTVIMGRNTYEFGYKYGLEPGKPAYPHMKNYVFSESIKVDHPDQRLKICNLDLNIVKNLKEQKGSDIYLCGGGKFAGWLLENELIDILKIKLNPILLGSGIRLFGSSKKQYKMNLIENETFTYGLQIISYNFFYK